MSKERTLVPISEVESNIVSVSGSGFPDFLDVNRIGVDVNQVESICRLAGLKSLKIVFISKEVDEGLSIGSVGAAGAATAGMSVSATRTKDYDLSAHEQDFKCLTYFSGTIRLNILEVRKRIEASGQALRSMDAWGEELNRDLVSELRRLSRQALLSLGVLDVCGKGPGLLWILAISSKYDGMPGLQLYESLFLYFFLLFLCVNFSIFSLRPSGNNLKDVRQSFFNLFGMELDRWLIAQGRLRLGRKLIGVIEE